MSLTMTRQWHGRETMKCVDGLSVDVASWPLSHAKGRKAGLGDDYTDTAADRTSLPAKLQKHGWGGRLFVVH